MEEKKNKLDEESKKVKDNLVRMERIDIEKKNKIEYLESNLGDASN